MPDAVKPVNELGEMSGDPADIGAEDTANKGVAGGYAALDGDGMIDPLQMSFVLELVDDEALP